ncbi:MAG: hypothetical protein ACYSUP_05420, partial [Planctomycetota bacterium]
KAPTFDFEEYVYGENRYRTLQKSRPEVAERLLKLAKKDAAEKLALMQELAKLKYNGENE